MLQYFTCYIVGKIVSIAEFLFFKSTIMLCLLKLYTYKSIFMAIIC